MYGGGVILLLTTALASCQREIPSSDVASKATDEIVFSAAGPAITADVTTKASAVTSLSSFNASAVTGAVSDTQVWTNVSFSGDNEDGYKGDKWWPVEDQNYRFFASNLSLTYSSSGATVAATNATDVVCAYSASPSYKTRNTLSFEHIFARLGSVTVSAATGYTISNVSITVVPKTGGTYNLKTGAGQTDGTGWSSVSEAGSPSTIASATGANANDIYLAPGTYTLTASWRAVRGDYTEDIKGMQCDVDLVAGKINNITTTLSGNAQEVAFSVSIAAWTNQNVVAEFPTKIPSFAGLQIAPGPLMYENGDYVIKDNWNYASYGSVHGKNNGSTYFNFIEMGQLFEKSDFSTSDGNIDNLLNPLDGWRLPTKSECDIFLNGPRNGSCVNGINNSYYSLIQLTGITFAGSSSPCGLLIFPDDVIISGKNLNGINNSIITDNVTESELNNFISQGCFFLPASGYYYQSYSEWNSGSGKWCFMPTSTQSAQTSLYLLGCSYDGYTQAWSIGTKSASTGSKNGIYYFIWLVKPV